MSNEPPAFEARELTRVFGHGRHARTAVDRVSFRIEQGEIASIVGESGCGKSVLARMLLRLETPSAGELFFEGRPIDRAPDPRAHFRRVQAVFQDPYEVYNPFYRVRHIFDLAISRFKLAPNARDGRAMIEDALNVVGMRGEEVLEKYPHQLSGGQRQRMMVARAYMLRPKLIVADEPVSMVDASLRAMILDIMLKLRDEHGRIGDVNRLDDL